MRKVVVSMFLSLDGFVVGPREEMDWVISNFDAEGMGADMSKLQASADSFLMGRQTYQIMAGAWPNQTEATSPGADVMNNTPKLVASNTLKDTPWGKYGNARLLRGDVPEEVRKLKQKPGKDIVTFGSPKLVQSLAEAGLVDLFHIWLHPTLLGNGKPFFRGDKRVSLKLVASKVYKNGVVRLEYEPNRLAKI
jgi:dihydrofolate reductase